jgi:hypothetical protein
MEYIGSAVRLQNTVASLPSLFSCTNEVCGLKSAAAV